MKIGECVLYISMRAVSRKANITHERIPFVRLGFFAVLGFELQAYTLSQSTSPIFL
jgi:hypothetical protein